MKDIVGIDREADVVAIELESVNATRVVVIGWTGVEGEDLKKLVADCVGDGTGDVVGA